MLMSIASSFKKSWIRKGSL